MRRRLVALALSGMTGGLGVAVAGVVGSPAHACLASSAGSQPGETDAGPVYANASATAWPGDDPSLPSAYVGAAGSDPTGANSGYVEVGVNNQQRYGYATVAGDGSGFCVG